MVHMHTNAEYSNMNTLLKLFKSQKNTTLGTDVKPWPLL